MVFLVSVLSGEEVAPPVELPLEPTDDNESLTCLFTLVTALVTCLVPDAIAWAVKYVRAAQFEVNWRP